MCGGLGSKYIIRRSSRNLEIDGFLMHVISTRALTALRISARFLKFLALYAREELECETENYFSYLIIALLHRGF